MLENPIKFLSLHSKMCSIIWFRSSKEKSHKSKLVKAILVNMCSLHVTFFIVPERSKRSDQIRLHFQMNWFLFVRASQILDWGLWNQEQSCQTTLVRKIKFIAIMMIRLLGCLKYESVTRYWELSEEDKINFPSYLQATPTNTNANAQSKTLQEYIVDCKLWLK